MIVQFLEYYRAMNPEICEIKSSDLYSAYKVYCKEFKADVMTLRGFGMEVKKVIGEPTHTMRGNVYIFNNTNTIDEGR